jgi:hypothetical protein
MQIDCAEHEALSDQAILDVAKEVLCVLLRFFGSGWVAPIFKCYFLQRNIRGVLRLKAAGDQSPGARSETFRIGNIGWLSMSQAIVALELG